LERYADNTVDIRGRRLCRPSLSRFISTHSTGINVAVLRTSKILTCMVEDPPGRRPGGRLSVGISAVALMAGKPSNRRTAPDAAPRMSEFFHSRSIAGCERFAPVALSFAELGRVLIKREMSAFEAKAFLSGLV
jgi:hypothetical protein